MLGIASVTGASAKNEGTLKIIVPDTPLVSRMVDTTEIDPLVADSLVSMSNMTSDELKEEHLKDGHKIIYTGSGNMASLDSLRHMIAMFYVDQFRSFQDPLAPYFLLMSKDAKLAMGIGGSVRMRGWFDFDGAMPANGFVPYLIPVPADPSQRRRIGGTPGGTALFFRVIGRNKVLGDVMAYIQCDFSGANNVTFKLKKAYVVINDWTVGYAATTFSDPQADAPTIDGAGSNGRLSSTRMLVRWNHTFKNRWQVAASVEMPSSQTDADGVNTKQINDWMPDYAAFVQYQWSHQSHVRLSGVVRTLPYRDLVAQKNRNIIGWGTQLSAVVHPLPQLTLYGAANIGRGYESCMADLSIGNYDLTTQGTTPGRMYAPMSFGVNIGAKYNFTENIYACVALGQARYLPKYEVDPTDYKYGQYGAINIFWEPTARLQVGLEYLRGKRKDFNGERGTANRFDALFQFSF